MPRRFLIRCLCLLICCTQVLAVESGAQDTAEIKKGDQSLGIEFNLHPVELDVTEELEDAKERYNQGDWLAVVENLQTFQEQYPGDDHIADALFLKAEALAQLKRYRETRKEFLALLKLGPNDTQATHALFRIAEATMLLGETEKAKSRLQEFQKRYPEHELNAYVLPYLAETVARLGDYALAEKLFAESTRKFSDGPLATKSRLHTALLHYQKGNYAKARDQLSGLIDSLKPSAGEYVDASYWLAISDFHLKRWGSASERLEQFIDNHPRHSKAASAALYAAQCQRQQNAPENALALLQRLESTWPNHSEQAAAKLLGIQVNGALGRHEVAYKLFEDFEGNETQKEDAIRAVADLLLKDGEFRNAEKLVRPLAQRRASLITRDDQRKHYTNLFLFALAQRGLGRTSQAILTLRRIRLESVESRFGEQIVLARAQTMNAAEDHVEAIEACRDYLARFPNGELRPAILSEMVLGLVGVERFTDAKSRFQQLVTEQSSDEIVRASRQLGEALYHTQDWKGAREIFAKLASVATSKEDQARALSGLAWISLKEGHREAAAEKFNAYIEQFPGEANTARVRLAHAQNLAELNRTDQAIEELQFFIDLNASAPSRAQALYQLAELLHRTPDQLEDARRIIDLLLEEHESYSKRDAAIYLSGIIRSKLDDDAEPVFQELVDGHPASPYWADALYRLAKSANERQQTPDAKRYLTKLISIQRDGPVLPHALYMLGRIESDEQDWSKARDTLRQLLKQYPQSYLVPLARYGVAESFYQEKDFQRALQHLAKPISGNRSNRCSTVKSGRS